MLPASRKYSCLMLIACELEPGLGQPRKQRLVDSRQKPQRTTRGECPIVVWMGFGHRRTMRLEDQHRRSRGAHLLPAPPPVATSFPASGLAERLMIDQTVFTAVERHGCLHVVVSHGSPHFFICPSNLRADVTVFADRS